MIARLLALTAIKCRLSYWRSPPQVQILAINARKKRNLLPLLFSEEI